jgi:hypothetical protein
VSDPLDRRRHASPGEADDAELLSESPAVAPTDALGGQLGSASGGYGSGSDANSSGGTGDGTDDASSAGDDAQTDWLRDAPGGGDR